MRRLHSRTSVVRGIDHGGQVVKSTANRDSIEAVIRYVTIALIAWLVVVAAALVIMRA